MIDIAEADESAVSGDDNAHSELHRTALDLFAAASPMAILEARAEMLSDRRFVFVTGAQWEGAWGEQFSNSIMVEVNKTAQGLEKIERDYRNNRVTVNFRGVGTKADEETADTMDGMFRADVYACKGGQAFDNAFTEGAAGGQGAWRLLNVWEDPLDKENDRQRIAFAAIPDADQSVFWDPNSKLYDKSDARYCFVVVSMSPQAYKDEYGDNPTDWPDLVWDHQWEWLTPEAVRVAEFYEVEEKNQRLEIYRNRSTNVERREWSKDLTAEDRDTLEIEGWQRLRVRTCKRRRVMKSVLSGGGVLRAPKQIAGTMIPIVPYYGKRTFVDGMERCQGHVRWAKDPQRIYNAQISKLTETAAAAPLERPIVTPEQVAGHEQSWADANLNRSPYALLNPIVNPDGSVAASGPIGTISPPQMSPVMGALIQITANDIAELTNSQDGADEVKSNVSAESMDMAATRVDEKSDIYLDNMRQSMQRCGEVWADMARDVYFEEGREVETLSEQGDHGTAVLSEGVSDPKTGAYSVRNDIAHGKYKVISDVTEQTATRRDKTVRTLVNGAQMVAGFDPSLARAMIITAMTNMDGEGMNDLQDYVRKIGVGEGIIKPTPEEEQAMAEAQQNQQPDPEKVFLAASAEKATADAGKSRAQTATAEADTALKQAQTEKTLAEAHSTRQEGRMGILERAKSFFTPPKPPAAPSAGTQA